MNRAQQVADITRTLAELMETDPTGYTYADAQRDNDGDGFVIERSAPGENNIVRWEGVRLSETELRQAWDAAQKLLA